MTYELSPEHEQFRRSVRDFAEKEIAPHAAQWDRDHHFPIDVVQKMGELGLMGLTAPEEYGGAGMAARTAASPRCAWPSRRSGGSTSRWASRSRPPSASASTRS